jgi:uridine kinase
MLVGVTGGSASGKTSICSTIADMITLEQGLKTIIIPLDCFYIPIKPGVDPSTYNFDHPDALDMDMARRVLERLERGESCKLPQYCFKTHTRVGEIELEAGAQVIFFEGIFVLNDDRIRKMMKYRIYVNCDNDIRLCRRVNRDIKERGRNFEGVIRQYFKFVRPAYQDFIEPMMKYANLVVPSTTNNRESIDFIVNNLLSIVRGFLELKKDGPCYFFGERYMFNSRPKKDRA